MLRISQSPSITGTSPPDCLVSYPRHSLGGGLTPLQRCSRSIQQPQLNTTLYTETFRFNISIVFCLLTVNVKTVLFQTIQFSVSTQFQSQNQFYFNHICLTYQNSSISNNSVKYKYTVSMSKTILFQAIQFSTSKQFLCKISNPFQTIQFTINKQFSYFWPIGRTLSGATTPCQSGLGECAVALYCQRSQVQFGVVAPDGVLSVGQIELNCLLMVN